MNETEQNFEHLKKLLKLKQHEVPPPGYFHHFSGQVVARIRAGEAAKAKRHEMGDSWLAGLLRIFDTKPGLVGGFATSLCLLLLLTVVFAERAEQAPKNIFATAEAESAAAPTAASPTANTPMLATASVTGGIAVSTNPVTSIQPVATMFGQPASAGLFQQASFAPMGQ
jgi:hypothetical protein